MSKESTPQLQIDDIEKYDATENLMHLLQKLSIKSAKPALKDLRYDLKGEFYCGECDAPIDDCFGHPDDYPDYEIDYDEHAFEETVDKPNKNE